MRLFFFPLFAVFVQLTATPSSLAIPTEPPGSDPFPFDELINQQIIMAPKEVTTDDYLLNLANAADINLIADSTNFDEVDDTPEVISNRGQGRLGEFVYDAVHRRRLTYFRLNRNTFLCWPSENRLELARSVVQAHVERKKLEDKQAVTLPVAQAPIALRAAYLQREKEWNSKDGGIDLRVKVSELPLPLRTRVLAEVLQQSTSLPYLHSRKYFNDEFWKTTRLHIDKWRETADARSPLLPYLVIYDGRNPNLPMTETNSEGVSILPIGRLSFMIGR
jgi:hypothetical protein